MSEKERIYFLELPSTDTIEGFAYNFLGSDGRSETSPQLSLNEVQVGDTLIGHLPGWRPSCPVPEEAAYMWVCCSAPNAVLTRNLTKVGEVPFKNWEGGFTIVVGESDDLQSFGQMKRLWGIRKDVTTEGEGEETIYTDYFTLLMSPLIERKQL